MALGNATAAFAGTLASGNDALEHWTQNWQNVLSNDAITAFREAAAGKASLLSAGIPGAVAGAAATAQQKLASDALINKAMLDQYGRGLELQAIAAENEKTRRDNRRQNVLAMFGRMGGLDSDQSSTPGSSMNWLDAPGRVASASGQFSSAVLADPNMQAFVRAVQRTMQPDQPGQGGGNG